MKKRPRQQRVETSKKNVCSRGNNLVLDMGSRIQKLLLEGKQINNRISALPEHLYALGQILQSVRCASPNVQL